MIETAEYEVVLTVRVSTHIGFAPMERDRPITPSDAIDNAIGSFDWSLFGNEGFDVAFPIEGEATLAEQ